MMSKLLLFALVCASTVFLAGAIPNVQSTQQGSKTNGNQIPAISPEQAQKIANAFQEDFKKMDADTLNDLVKLIDLLDNTFDRLHLAAQNAIRALKERHMEYRYGHPWALNNF